MNEYCVKEDIDKLICNHSGSFGFSIKASDIINIEQCIIYQWVYNKHIIRIEKDGINYIAYRASPGIGTIAVYLDASIFLEENSSEYSFMLTWTPEKFGFRMDSEKETFIYDYGKQSHKSLKADSQNNISEIGGIGTQIMGMVMISNNEFAVEPTALEQWNDIRTACNHLITHKNNEDFLYNTIIYGQMLCMTVTGFENFLKKRFMELQHEGVQIDVDNFQKKFPKGEKEINFQSWNDAKKAYKIGYNLAFGKFTDNKIIDSIKKYLQYRHRLVHSSPITMPLNLEDIQNGKISLSNAEHANAEMLEKAFTAFDNFVSELNKQTLLLERK